MDSTQYVLNGHLPMGKALKGEGGVGSLMQGVGVSRTKHLRGEGSVCMLFCIYKLTHGR